MSKRKTSRRSFLKGKSATEALADLTHGLNADKAKEQAQAASNSPARVLLELSRRAMACEFVIYLNSGQHKNGPERATEIFEIVDLLEDQMTVYRPHSEVSQINDNAAAEPVVVETGLFQLFERAVEISRLTNGAFDMTSGPLSKIWGFFRRQGETPTTAAISETLAKVGWSKLKLSPADESIQFGVAGMELNLGGIGKGYALDQGAEGLLSAGVENFLFHGGNSSVTARGAKAGESSWSVGLRDPLRPEIRLGEFALQDSSLATSGSGAQHFFHRGKRYGHILDPRTGWPADQVLSSTVITPFAADADALATACYVAGLEATQAICNARPDLAVLLLTHGKRAGTFDRHPFNLSADLFRPASD